MLGDGHRDVSSPLFLWVPPVSSPGLQKFRGPRASVPHGPSRAPGARLRKPLSLHLWTQIVGKIRLAQSPWTNHSRHMPLYVDCRGLTTSPIVHGGSLFEIRCDFLDQRLLVEPCAELSARLELNPRSVADVHAALFRELERPSAGA